MNINSFKHKTPIQVRYNDIDVLNHVNNAVYQQYLDMAKYNYFNDVLKGDFNFQTSMFVLAHIEINYTQAIVLHENISIYTKTLKIGTKSLKLQQVMYEEEKQAVKAIADSVMVAYNPQMKQSFQISDEWKLIISQHEQQ